MKSVVALVVLAFSCVCPPAFAEDAPEGIEIRRLADIYPHLPPPGSKRWTPDKLVAAVDASPMRFSPKHVYELIDKEVPQPVIKAVANKVGLFYDGTALPLHVQAANARQGAAAETITVDDSNPGAFFAWFESVFADIETAEDEAGLPDMRKPNETQEQYERRLRAADERRVQLVGPHEGRIQAATFVLSIPATVQERDGCSRPVANLDASSVDFNLFRDVMGTRLTETLIQFTSRSVDKMAFRVAPREIYALGRCEGRGSRLEMTLKRSAEGAWTGNGDFK